MKPSGENFEGLADAMEARRLDLDLTWAELADRAGVSKTTLDNIRAGRMPRPRTRRRIEVALGWAHGSVTAMLAGGLPTLAVDAPVRGPRPLDPLTSPLEEIAEFLEEVRQARGEEVYRELRDATIDVRQLAAEQEHKSLTSKEHEEL